MDKEWEGQQLQYLSLVHLTLACPVDYLLNISQQSVVRYDLRVSETGGIGVASIPIPVQTRVLAGQCYFPHCHLRICITLMV